MVQMILMLSLFLEKMILIFRESNQVIRMTTEIRLPHCIEVHSLTNFHILRWDVSIKSIYWTKAKRIKPSYMLGYSMEHVIYSMSK
jgi:hypothetical protein